MRVWSIKIEYLCHFISAERVQVDPDNFDCMVKWPVPKDFKALRGSLGLTGYYWKFIHDYGKLVAPLTALLKKDAFKWSDLAQQASDSLKNTRLLF